MDLKIKGTDNLQRLGQEFPKASARALNKTATHARAEMAKDARQRYKVRSSDVKASMKPLRRATPKRLIASFIATGKRMAAAYFAATSALQRSMQQKGLTIKRRKSPAFQITRGKKQVIPHSFAAKMKSGHIGIFTRNAGASLPIQEKTGPAASQMLSGAFTRLKDTREYLFKTLRHEIDWFTQNMRGGK